VAEEHSEGKRNVLIMADRLARFYYWVTQHLIRELGEEKAERFLQDVMRDYGVETGEIARAGVVEKGMEPTLDNYRYAGDLPSEGWERERMESTPELTWSKVHFCPFAHAWMTRYPGFEKWARIYCQIDTAKYETYDPQCRCVCESNLLDGDPYCVVKTFRGGAEKRTEGTGQGL